MSILNKNEAHLSFESQFSHGNKNEQEQYEKKNFIKLD